MGHVMSTGMKEREVESGYSWGYFVEDANTSKIYYLKMIQEQSIGNNLHFGLEDDTLKYLARACIRRATRCLWRHKLPYTHVKKCLLFNNLLWWIWSKYVKAVFANDSNHFLIQWLFKSPIWLFEKF